jgi:CDP-diacylglycerol---glycerol-3-phosphate 3-phosphatidyltransferase
LHREWLVLVLLSALFIAGGFWILVRAWPVGPALGWLAAATGLLIYHFSYLWRHLSDNRLKDESDAPVFPDLGLGNWLTITRAVLTAALTGFLLGPRPVGWLAWAPGLLYLVSAGIDYLDGYAARVTGRTTLLGEALDMKWDGVGLLAAATLSVFYGQTPWPYVLVGLARYLYLFGIWLREQRGLPIYPLPPSRFRRALAGVQMGFAGAILLPMFGPPVTWLAAWLFMLPFLIPFAYDFLAVSGWVQPRSFALTSVGPRMRARLSLALRALLIALLVSVTFFRPGLYPPEIEFLVVAVLIAMLLLGAAGRVAALIILLAAAFSLRSALFDWRYWLMMLSGAVLFMTGTGKYSVWKPEDWLIDHRAGETRKQ